MNSKKHRNVMLHSAKRTAVLGVTALVVGACGFNGLNSLDMPGTLGHGPGSFTIIAELPDISTLPQNSPVLVDDVTVGSVSGVKAKQRPDGTFYAEVTVSLNPQVHLPANSTVTIGQTSLLGSQHLELAAPITGTVMGRLGPGSIIPERQAGYYPTTEEVLSSLGVVVSKGNLGALQDITNELYTAVAGHAGQFDAFLPRLAELAAAVDAQSTDLVAAIEKLNRFAGAVARNSDQLGHALDALPPALRVLDANAARVVDTFIALRHFAQVASRILAQTKVDFASDAKDAYSVIKPLADHASDLVDALPELATYPLPQTGIKQAVRGDFLNVFVTLDLTQRRFGENLFTTSPLDPNMKHLDQIVNPPDFLLGEMANLSGQAADPFKIPLAPTEGGPPR